MTLRQVRPWLCGGVIGVLVGASLTACVMRPGDRREAAAATPILRQVRPPVRTFPKRSLPRGAEPRPFNGSEYWIVPLARSER